MPLTSLSRSSRSDDTEWNTDLRVKLDFIDLRWVYKTFYPKQHNAKYFQTLIENLKNKPYIGK